MGTLSEGLLQKNHPAAKAAHWLLESGIQDATPNPDYRGGVNAWFDLQSQTYPFIYAEITGYAVNAYLFFHSLTQEAAYLEAAKRAADWLCRHAYPEVGLIKTRLNQPSYEQAYFSNHVFTFDQWVIVYGLACLGAVSGQGFYTEKAQAMARFLMANTVKPDGSFYPLYHVANRQAEEKGDKWSREAGSFHAKALMALCKLAEMTGDESYRACAQKLFRFALTRQQPDGRFVTQLNEKTTHLHPHLYTLEGLAAYGLAENNAQALEAALKGLEWVLKNQNPDGTVCCFYTPAGFLPFVRTDILAQTLRMGAVLQQRGVLDDEEGRLAKLRARLAVQQITGRFQHGGFFYGQEENGAIHPHINAWVTMFAAQALAAYDLFRASGPAYGMSFFV